MSPALAGRFVTTESYGNSHCITILDLIKLYILYESFQEAESPLFFLFLDFAGGSDSKVSAHNAGDLGSIPGWEDPLEKEMATHSSILAWKTPWTEESSSLQSMGS